MCVKSALAHLYTLHINAEVSQMIIQTCAVLPLLLVVEEWKRQLSVTS